MRVRADFLSVWQISRWFARDERRGIFVGPLLRNIANLSASLRTSYNGFQWKTSMHRALEVLITCILIVLVFPLMAVVALAIKLDSPGPVLCRTERVGLDGRCRINLLKFRTTPCRAGRVARGTPRTRLEQFLHVTGIEELPQLFYILRGDLSLLGADGYPGIWSRW